MDKSTFVKHYVLERLKQASFSNEHSESVLTVLVPTLVDQAEIAWEAIPGKYHTLGFTDENPEVTYVILAQFTGSRDKVAASGFVFGREYKILVTFYINKQVNQFQVGLKYNSRGSHSANVTYGSLPAFLKNWSFVSLMGIKEGNKIKPQPK